MLAIGAKDWFAISRLVALDIFRNLDVVVFGALSMNEVSFWHSSKSTIDIRGCPVSLTSCKVYVLRGLIPFSADGS